VRQVSLRRQRRPSYQPGAERSAALGAATKSHPVALKARFIVRASAILERIPSQS
jgi:hypothetical protein